MMKVLLVPTSQMKKLEFFLKQSQSSEDLSPGLSGCRINVYPGAQANAGSPPALCSTLLGGEGKFPGTPTVPPKLQGDA